MIEESAILLMVVEVVLLELGELVLVPLALELLAEVDEGSSITF